MTNVNKLFTALPRDLQWEVLTVFLGSHSVRKGKLIRKMDFDARHQMIQDIPRIQKCYIEQYIQAFNTKSFVQLPSGSQLMFCECPYTGYMGYKFRQVIKRECSWMPKAYGLEYTSLTYSAPLPLHQQHSYPSYEDTDKKKAIRFSNKITEESVMRRLSLIRPCDLDDDVPHRFMGLSPLTLGECRTPDEPLPWIATQFHLEIC